MNWLGMSQGLVRYAGRCLFDRSVCRRSASYQATAVVQYPYGESDTCETRVSARRGAILGICIVQMCINEGPPPVCGRNIRLETASKCRLARDAHGRLAAESSVDLH